MSEAAPQSIWAPGTSRESTSFVTRLIYNPAQPEGCRL
jgi:hypothetical protein